MSIHLDNIDIDGDGQGIMKGLCCIECHIEVTAHFGPGDVYCPSCMMEFCEV